MKKTSLLALLLGAPLALLAQTTVFNDTLGGSTVDSSSPAAPTGASTAYQIISGKSWSPTPSIAANHLKFGIGSTSSGAVEMQALFTPSPVTLKNNGDYVQLAITFTNTSGILTASGYLGMGLYNSGQVQPIAGGMNATATTSYSTQATGGAQNWQGYLAVLGGVSGYSSGIYSRLAQGGPNNNDQDLINVESGSMGYTNPVGAVIGTTNAGLSSALTASAQYTELLNITLQITGTTTNLAITNTLYAGTASTGTVIIQSGTTASGSTFITNSFDGLALGYYAKASGSANNFDVNQVTVTEHINGSPGPLYTVGGGGAGCPGNTYTVTLSGSVSTNAYYLYTNGVADGAVAAQTGTGSALSFGPISVLGTDTILASNTVSGYTGLMNGSASISTLPAPSILTEPTAMSVVTNGTAAFSVTATNAAGYQWYKNGAALTTGGDVAGANTATLTISPATTADAATTAAGYYCIITNLCGVAAITTTNSLTLTPPITIVWQGGNPNTNWNLATTANFTNSAGAAVDFYGGDNVQFDDTSTNPVVNITGSVLAPGAVTDVANANNYVFTGSGSITGPGSLLLSGTTTLTISNVNTFAGGTVISNGDIIIKTADQEALGTGTITLAGGTLEAALASGAAPAGVSNNIAVTANSTLQFDGSSTYALNLYGELLGTSSATLTVYNYLDNTTVFDRVRLYGAFTNSLSIALTSLGNEVQFSPYNATGEQVYNGVISGSQGQVVPRGAGATILNGNNTFNDSGVSGSDGPTGYSLLLSGSTVGVGADTVGTYAGGLTSSPLGTGNVGIDVTLGTSTVFASGAAHTIGNELIYTSATNSVILAFSGSNNLTWSGPIQLNGADSTGTNRTFQINNTALTTLSGVIDDAGLSCGIIVTGTGKLALNGADTYTGPTIVSNGVVEGTGILDYSAVTVEPTGTIGAGTTSIGTLTITNSLTLLGNVLAKLDTAVSPSNDVIQVTAVTNLGTGTVTVTNLGPALAVGEKFKLFSTAVVGGNTLTVTGGGVNWTNRLALDGSISVLSIISTVATNPTNIVATTSGNHLTLTWPMDHQGWYLQAQTNTLSKGLSTNWVDVANSSTTNSVVMPINPANPAVFYRLSSTP